MAPQIDPPSPPSLVVSFRCLTDLLQSVNAKYVTLGCRTFHSHLVHLAFAPFLLYIAVQLLTSLLSQIWQLLHLNLSILVSLSAALVFGATIYCLSQRRAVYLVDFACAEVPEELKLSTPRFLDISKRLRAFTNESIDFQRRICERSGVGDETYLPPILFRDPPDPCLEDARREAEAILFNAVDNLLQKTGVSPTEIGILIVNSSLFTPTPSLTSMIVNKYKMGGHIKSFNLSGMGCSAGLISIDLAKRLLQVHRNTYALVLSTENITLNWYWGNEKSMLLSNCIFRMGGAAVLLSSRAKDRTRSKYELVHSVRTQKGTEEQAFRCVFQDEDAAGNRGVALSKDLMAVAGNALKTNITTLGPLVLPFMEQILFFLSLTMRRLGDTKSKPYIPNFKLAFEHFCIHAGGRAVLDEIEKNLHLTEWHMEPSRMTLYRFGNTSSSSLWYELAYTEAKGRICKGDRIWQIAFGSGFKCNSVVWRALRAVPPSERGNPWSNFIDKFPVTVPSMASL